MKKTSLKIFLSLFFLFSISVFGLSEAVFSAPQQKISLSGININGDSIDFSRSVNIVISEKDSITFSYSMDKSEIKPTKPFFYKIALTKDNFTSEKTSGLNEITYSNLQEGNYIFKVNSFDLSGDWISNVVQIKFRVNNAEANLMKKIDVLSKEKIIADSILNELKQSISEQTIYVTHSKVMAIVAAIIVIIFLVLLIIFISKSNKEKKIIEKLKIDLGIYTNKANELEEKIFQDAEKNEAGVLKSKIEWISKKIEGILELNSEVDTVTKNVKSKESEISGLKERTNAIFTDIVNGISNPTAAIKSLVELLRNYDFNADDMKNIVDNIIDSTKKIISLSEDIQRFVEFETENLVLNLDTVEVRSVVNEVVEKNIYEAKRKNISLNTQFNSGVNTIKLDVQKIIVALDNIVDNALKFTRDGGKISINCYNKSNSLFIEVADNGLGISQSDLQKIYDSMKSEQNNIKTNPNSIGLLTVKKYVEVHGGNVLVSSILGKGSTFSFNIPYNLQ